ncbi:MAG TPA: Gfo/Idh/MocA family oxidoreductase [Actinomycetota bacterium]|nr:Gfo/Idh/MocA family oxidoreductase [Actinomycetota bacterium]
MTRPVRIGLLGYGFSGRRIHTPLLDSAPECELVGVATIVPQERALVSDELGGRPAYGSLEELAQAGAEAVTVATPIHTHVSLAQEALRRGMGVVCEKPFAPDAATARAAVELAEELRLPLTVFQNRRWDSDFRTLQKLIGTGALGTISRFESRFERYRLHPGPNPSGGGTLRDFGSHLVDQALVLFGPVSLVYAEMHVCDEERGLDNDMFVALTHESGVHSHIWGSWRQGAPGTRFRVTGSTGTFVVEGVDGQEARLLTGASPATDGDRWGEEPPERWGRIERGNIREAVPLENGAWNMIYPSFAAAVRNEGPIPVAPRDALATATVLDAARLSATTGRTVRLDKATQSLPV